MAESAVRERWDHTADLLWLMAEINRDPKQRAEPFTADDFHRVKLMEAAANGPTEEELQAARQASSDINRAMDAPVDSAIEVVINRGR